MKGKSLLAIAVIALGSSNAFSMEIVNGKVLDHKVWSTGNSKSVGTFKEIPFDQAKLASLLKKHKDEPISYFAAADRMHDVPTRVTVGDTVNVSGDAASFIRNETLSRKGYLISNEICYSPGTSSLMGCLVESYHIYLDVGGYVNFRNQPEEAITFNEVGRSYVEVATEIEDETEGNNAVFSSDDFRMIYVDPAKK